MVDLSPRLDSYAPQLSQNFRVIIEGYTALGELTVSVDTPVFSTASEPFLTGAGEVKYPSSWTLGDVSLTFKETAKGDALGTLMDWKRLVLSEDDDYGYANVYKRRIIVQMLNSVHDHHSTHVLDGCFPIDTAYPSLSYAGGSEIALVTQNFSADEYFFS